MTLLNSDYHDPVRNGKKDYQAGYNQSARHQHINDCKNGTSDTIQKIKSS
jgi:hypothetical protein